MRTLTIAFATALIAVTCFAQGRAASRGGHGGRYSMDGGGFRGGYVHVSRSFSGAFTGRNFHGYVSGYHGPGWSRYRGGWHHGSRFVGFSFGWYDPWFYSAGYYPPYYDYGCYDNSYYGWYPSAYYPYGYYSGTVPISGGVVYSRAGRRYVRGPVRRYYGPAGVVAGDGRWHHFGER